MNDDELLTAVREQRSKVPMTVPAEQVIRRGRAVRAGRRIVGLAQPWRWWPPPWLP